MKTSDEFVKKLQQKNSGVVVWPIEACNIFSRLELSTSCEKKGGKEKKLLHCSFYVCVYFTIETKKRHLSCRRVGERATVATVAVLFLQFWCYTL